MQLITYTHNGATRTGAIRDDQLVDLNATDATIASDMLSLLQGGDAMMEKARAAAEAANNPIAIPKYIGCLV